MTTFSVVFVIVLKSSNVMSIFDSLLTNISWNNAILNNSVPLCLSKLIIPNFVLYTSNVIMKFRNKSRNENLIRSNKLKEFELFVV